MSDDIKLLEIPIVKIKETLNPKDIIKDYKSLKLEFWSYLEGLTKGSWNAKDKVRNFFHHLEFMIFGKKISINDLSKL